MKKEPDSMVWSKNSQEWSLHVLVRIHLEARFENEKIGEKIIIEKRKIKGGGGNGGNGWN